MKVICEINVSRDELTPDCYRQLRERFPEGGTGGVFMSRLPLENLRNKEIMTYLVDCGMTIPESFWHRHVKNMICVVYGREYEAHDFEVAEYLEPWPDVTIAYGAARNKEGTLEISTGYMRRFRFACAGAERVVSNDFRPVMQKAGFKHLRFEQAVVVGEGAERYEEPIWEMTSDLTMPPVSPSVRFCDEQGNPVGDPFKGRRINDGLYAPPEFHYTRNSLEALGDFDVARVREGMHTNYKDHPLIVSQRFYRFCIKHKLKMDWIPVRIDPD